MLAKIDRFAAAALIRLRNQESGLLEFFKQELSETMFQMVELKDADLMRQAQGKSKFLLDLLELIEKSPGLVDKLDRQTHTGNGAKS